VLLKIACVHGYVTIFRTPLLLLSVPYSSDSMQREVTSAEVEQFQLKHALVVLPIANRKGPRLTSDPTSPDGREGIKVNFQSTSNTVTFVNW
jgi:hypothetical protein